MTHGDGESSRRIRIRVTGDDAQNLEALHRWLSLEDWFAQAEAEQRLKVVYREGDGEERDPREHREGPPMSGGLVELVLVIAGAALSPVFDDLYRRARVAVRAWADNTSTSAHPVLTTVATDDADDTDDEVGSGDPETPSADGDDHHSQDDRADRDDQDDGGRNA